VKVILQDDVVNLGGRNAVVEVADGYARNYLIPRGLAMPATKGALRGLESQRRVEDRRQSRLKTHASTIAERLEKTPLRIKARVGEMGRLFGSVTTQMISSALKEQFDVEIDRHRIELGEPIKTPGAHAVPVLLPGSVRVNVNVEVVSESEDVVEEPTAQSKAAATTTEL
jgi:large subunit ribosomal protein L9